ncbi:MULTISPECIES: hypothetical protein [unclassified Streptomyces]|uniref:hypothetical protein n=1 Tax=unclassified Streptomyces TaxID=2593676 RepID=UPI0033C545E6
MNYSREYGENRLMDLRNVPVHKVTVEVKDENTALVESLRKDLGDLAKKLRDAEDSKKYWTQCFDGERATVRSLQAKLSKAEEEAGLYRRQARSWEGQASSGHRYVQLVKHLTERKNIIEAAMLRAEERKDFRQAQTYKDRLAEIRLNLEAAGVR